jgi:hypothetical protein
LFLKDVLFAAWAGIRVEAILGQHLAAFCLVHEGDFNIPATVLTLPQAARPEAERAQESDQTREARASLAVAIASLRSANR